MQCMQLVLFAELDAQMYLDGKKYLSSFQVEKFTYMFNAFFDHDQVGLEHKSMFFFEIYVLISVYFRMDTSKSMTSLPRWST